MANSRSRLSNSLSNVASGGVLQILTILLNFAVRVVFVRVIGYSYLGISSLFANILTILSVADLGFGTSISISLYAALKKGDEDHIAGILTYYKKIYLIIGGVIFVTGCIICPFVKYIVNTDTPIQFIELYFFIYLVNLVSTYFISYRHAIVKADQKNGILNNINSAILLAKSAVELLVIAIIPRVFNAQAAYITYLIVMVLSTYAIEIWSSRVAKKLYPYAFNKKVIPPDEKREIKHNVRDLLLYKVCTAVNKSVDGILISILVSTTILGKYSNYTLIIGTLMGFGCLISRNSIASLGNYVLTESTDKQVRMFYLISFVHFVIAAFFAVNYVGILSSFFTLAFGPESTLSILVLAFSAIHICFDVNYQVNELFRETTKMFKKIPYIAAINLVLNIALSILLGYYFGLEGIIGGTLIAYFLTSFWFETFALFKYYFKRSAKIYWLKLIYVIVSIAAFSTATYFITSSVNLGDDFLQVAYSIGVSLPLSILCILSFAWFSEFKETYRIAKSIFVPIANKIHSFFSKKKVQTYSLLASIAALILLIVLRDLFALEINKIFYVIVAAISLFVLKKENFIGYVLFLIPFHSGLPTNFIYPIVVVCFILKNLKIFKNWRLIVNYFGIPLFVFIMELVMSSIYGGTTPFVDALSIFLALSMTAFIIYDKQIISNKPIKLFIIGASAFGVILFAHWFRVALYMSSHTAVSDMTLARILTKQRFGDVSDLISWTEEWCKVTYPYKTTMYLTDNENYVGLIMLMLVMSSTHLLFRKEKTTTKLLLIIPIIIGMFLGIYTGSKSFFACFAFFALFFITMLYAENRIKLWHMLALLGSISATATIVCLKVPFVNEYIVQRLNSDSGRFALIGQYLAFTFSKANYALFGVGISRMTELSGFTEPAHNALVQIVGGYGIFGFFVIVSGLVLTISKARPRIRMFRENIMVAIVPLFTFVLFSMTSQIFLPPNTLLYGLPAIYIYIYRSNLLVKKERLDIHPFDAKKSEKRMMKWLKRKQVQETKNYKTVLVTGAAGFIGSFLCEKLLNTTNYKIVGLDNMNSYYDVSLKKARLKKFENNKNFIFVKGDISDRDLIDNLFEKYYFDIVVNLAAQAGVRYSIDHPDDYIKSNVIGMYYILEACRYHPLEHLVYASSSSVYGGNTKIPFSTDDKVDNPVSLYAATKKSDELLAHAYSKLYNIPTTGLRFFTVYGPMGRPDMAYFSFTNKLIKGESIDIFNYGNCKRDFTYVDDIVEGITKVMENPPEKKAGEDGLPIPPYKVYNIGNSNPENLMDFVNTLADALKTANVLPGDFDIKRHIKLVPMQKGDVEVTYADTSDLEKDFGYKPSTPLSEGLKKFAEWYKEYYK